MNRLYDCLNWLDDLERAPSVTTTGQWRLSTVLDHCAQSIEMSMDGFPKARSPLFQSTVGKAAFAAFRWRGRMRHGLAEPIPGAAALADGVDWRPAAQRLRRAIVRFDACVAPLAPHFAYGALSKDRYTLAHRLHIANHWGEIVAER